MNFKIGHVILAEFERTISNEYISRFVSILEHEENTEIPTGLELLNGITKLQYGLWKGLVQKYFGNISSKSSIEKNCLQEIYSTFTKTAVNCSKSSFGPASQENLEFCPVPTISEKPSRKRLVSFPILTGERAKRQLADQEKRKQGREKKQEKKNKFFDEDYDEDLDEGYRQYMAT